jgi:hypothetical protein
MLYPFRVNKFKLIVDLADFESIEIKKDTVVGKINEQTIKIFKGTEEECIDTLDDIENILRVK